MTPTPSNPTLPDPTTDYARSVVEGKTIAGPYVRLAAQRHLKDLANAEAQQLVWSAEKAYRAIKFFSDILTVEVETQDEDGSVTSQAVPFILQPWQCFIIGSIFGWLRSSGLRRFRRAYVEIGKGNGKSPMAAGIGHYMLTATGKLRAEIYSAATDKDQAAILFRDAVAMWERSPHLNKRLLSSGVNPVWQLTHLEKASFFKPISSDKKGKSGIRPYCALIDEVHEHPDNSVIEMLRAGTKGNQDALIFEITNSGFDRKSVCWSEHEYTTRLLSGEVENDQWFGFICSIDDDDNPFEDESCWIKANPNLGISIQPQFIREQVNEAKGMPSKESIVRRLHFCEWVDSETAAFSRAQLEKVLAPVDAEEMLRKGYKCYGGLDLSRTKDLTAFTLTWVLDPAFDKQVFASKTWYFTPKDTLAERSKKDRTPYDTWAKAGHMTAVPGQRINYGYMAEALAELVAKFHPEEIAADQYGLENLRDHASEKNITLPCVVHPQGFQRRKVSDTDAAALGMDGVEEIVLWMPDSINKLEAAIIEERITIEDQPVNRMCLAGVVYEQNRTGHRMFAKDKSTTRIDGAVSLAMSIGMATVGAAPVKKSFWEAA